MKKQQDQQRDTEALIMQAAEKEFLEKGYSGAKTTSIAEVAGVTHAMFHYYFRTKDKLFEKIVAEKMGQLKDLMFSAICNAELPLKERIVLGVECHFDFIAANPLLPRFVFNELYNNPERVGKIQEELFAIAEKLLDNLQSAIDSAASLGQCRKVEARMILLDIISLNIFPFVAEPLIGALLAKDGDRREELLEKRKKENVRTILAKLNLT
ncbi:MAG: TetR/AcrR family transcriptional regulator [Muribaculaceae bacterium]|nr:TetR/AcrR family transcriptional regulator [Muribaculaceae bacterium]